MLKRHQSEGKTRHNKRSDVNGGPYFNGKHHQGRAQRCLLTIRPGGGYKGRETRKKAGGQGAKTAGNAGELIYSASRSKGQYESHPNMQMVEEREALRGKSEAKHRRNLSCDDTEQQQYRTKDGY